MRIGKFEYYPHFNIQFDRSSHPVPLTFFKYYSLSENSVSAITTPYLYASHPNQLNDPFDCDKDIIRFDDEKTSRSFLNGYYSVVSKMNDEDKNDFLQRAFNTIAYKKCGIFSITDRPDNELMWAHYAGKNGVCVEFDIRQFPFDYYGPYPINYVATLPIIKTSITDISVAMAIQCNVKSNNWSYEHEWRLIVPSPTGVDMKSFGYWEKKVNSKGDHDRRFNYPIMAIKRIILGVDFFQKQDEGNTFFVNNCLSKRLLRFHFYFAKNRMRRL